MTLTVMVKTNDGVVLAADSATTMLRASNEGGREIVNIYTGAQKIIPLLKGVHRARVAAITYGAGNIGNASTATVLKDLSDALLTAGSPICYGGFTEISLERVATLAKAFIFDMRYSDVYGKGNTDRTSESSSPGTRRTATWLKSGSSSPSTASAWALASCVQETKSAS